MSKTVLERGVEIAGGQSAFARMVGTSQQRVGYMLSRSKPLPGEFVFKAEAGTGIPRSEWRPDLYPIGMPLHEVPCRPSSSGNGEAA